MTRTSACLLTSLMLVSVNASAQLRTRDQRDGPPVAAVARPCAVAAPVISLVRRTALEREWHALEKDLEAPLRAVVAADLLTQEALASLEQRVLLRYDWTLTRYLVRTLRELRALDLQAADRLLRLDGYAQHALRDAAWDGVNGWDVVSAVRTETLQVLASLEIQRIADSLSQGDRDAETETGLSGPQRIVERLLQAASEREPYAVASTCTQPRDGIPPLVAAPRLAHSPARHP